ncbi:hypothetical protein [Candidatus Nitrospira allomarina]|uniref:Uncharacterized protein n=1 Tax=Candidatus Nitrospira allomarina TaxID=3020900 RepID=A0AA96JWG8_9BACT|nr:hypothetical protein [Candidatus Nitrospira allomarina]WNM57871.1 hypothetical protein PP769_18155 [Candidatus Nitrospira allomarina]
MPNTLAHIGVQGFLNQAVKPGIDPKLVCLGCLLPDIPWIFQRVLLGIMPGGDPYTIRLYCIAQASLFVTLVLCGALAFLSKTPKPVFMILGVNVLLHLVLDGLQTKWANGVHLFAPLSWDLWNVGLFWPESLPTYIMTGGGLLYIGWQWQKGISQPLPFSPWSPLKVSISASLLILYFALPLVIIEGPRNANNHFVLTLEETEARPGRPLELDRSSYEKTPTGDMIGLFNGEEIRSTQEILDHSATVSIRGRFVTPTQLDVLEFHEHYSWFRDTGSYLGILLLLGMWLGAFIKQGLLHSSSKSDHHSSYQQE